MRFYIGLHCPNHASHFDRCMVSVNRLRNRKGPFAVNEWIMDSGAFTEVARHGGYRQGPEEYAEQIQRWSKNGNLVAAVAQDWMCEPFVLNQTGCTVEEHQARTIARYIPLCAATDTYIMPVLQGWQPADYAKHVRDYGNLLEHGAWVGVGSVCKRNSDVAAIEDVLLAVHHERPDLRLHGFGLKLTALSSDIVRRLLWSSDSMAWSYAARVEGRNANDWREAQKYVRRVEIQATQISLWTLN